jgi:hypothetical protein
VIVVTAHFVGGILRGDLCMGGEVFFSQLDYSDLFELCCVWGEVGRAMVDPVSLEIADDSAKYWVCRAKRRAIPLDFREER